MINVSIRNFSLENEKGQIYSMSDVGEFPQFFNPQGLGLNVSGSYSQVGSDFIVNSEIIDMMKPKFDVHCRDMPGSTANDQYDSILAFFAYSETVYLNYYNPTALGPNPLSKVRAEVRISSFEKSEKKENATLVCPLVLDRLTHWKRDESQMVIIDSSSSVGKVYDYIYDYTYGNETAGENIVSNKSFVAVPLNVIINGPSQNPIIKLIDSSTGRTYSSLQILGTLSQDEYFRISSDYTNHAMEKISDGQITNVWDSHNRQLDNLLLLKPGKTLVAVSNDLDVFGPVSLKWSETYATI